MSCRGNGVQKEGCLLHKYTPQCPFLVFVLLLFGLVHSQQENRVGGGQENVLLRAEAKMRSGDNTGAADDINLLRKRAQCEYLVQASEVNVDLILDERARELVYEECRWNTLLRMGGTVAVDRIKKYAY